MGFLNDIKGRVTELTDQAKSGELVAKAKAAAEQVAAKTTEVADEVKGKVGELAEEHGGKVTEVVAKAGTFVDEKTGGKSASVTGKINEATDKAVSTVAAGAEHEGAAQQGVAEADGDAAAEAGAEPTGEQAEATPESVAADPPPKTDYGTATFSTPPPPPQG